MVTVIKDSLPISYYNSANLATNIESFHRLGGLIQVVNRINEEEKGAWVSHKTSLSLGIGIQFKTSIFTKLAQFLLFLFYWWLQFD